MATARTVSPQSRQAKANHTIGKRLALLVLVSMTAAACTTEVTDVTSSPFAYNAPINEQTFGVEVRSSQTVEWVDIVSPSFGTQRMSEVGDGRYELTVPIGLPCDGAVEFEVNVRTDRTFTRPENGRFTHQVSNLPDACDGFDIETAKTFDVTTTADFADGEPGDGQCAGAASETGCSLRAAVMEANANVGNDLIRVPAGRYVLTEQGDEEPAELDESIGDLDITDTLTIEGTGGTTASIEDFLMPLSAGQDALKDDRDSNSVIAKIDGNQQSRGLQVQAGAVLRLRHLAVVNGDSDGGQGGGLLNAGAVTLERVTFASNVADSNVARRGGGAISNSGVLQGFETAFTRNVVVSSNASGGAIESSGTVDLTRSLIAYNDARFASSLRNLTDGSLSLKNSTLFDNFCEAVCSGGPVSAISTFGTMHLRFVTFAGHREGSAILSRGSTGELNLSNSLFVDNSISACNRSMTSVGGNVLEGTCPFSYSLATADEDFVDVNMPAFGALADRGGYTPVYPISPPSEGSSLFDATDKSFLPPWPFFDQRGEGFERRVDSDGDGEAQADPGAYEYSS